MQTLHDCESIKVQYDEASLKDSIPSEIATCINKFQDECFISMSDDLHTTVALAAISEPLKTMNDLLHTRKVLLLSSSIYMQHYFRQCSKLFLFSYAT